MTVHALEFSTVGGTRRRPARTGRPSSAHPSAGSRRPEPRRQAGWSGQGARGCTLTRDAVRPVPPVAGSVGGGRLYWTPRGVAVMVLLVAVAVGVMLATMVVAFLAVSDAPAVAPARAATALAATVAAPA